MPLLIRTHLLYATTQPCDMLLQVEAIQDDAQTCRQTRLMFDPVSVARDIAGEEGLGTRKWITAGPLFQCDYETKVYITRPLTDIASLAETPRTQIPSDVVKYLLPSRYCHSELFLDFVSNQFGTLVGGAAIAQMRDWIEANFVYDSAASFLGMSAADCFAAQSGVCRDFAHVLICLARAAGVPARFVSAYAPDVMPQDFHAVVEVYLDGAWHLVDPTGMSKANETVRICVGRDAADASFMTSYGWVDLRAQSVEVKRVGH